jgi:CHAT domain-containing protein
MEKRILIVHPNPDMILTIRGILDDTCRSEGYKLAIKHAKTQKAAEELLETGPFDVVITGLEVALDEKPLEPAGEQARRGLALICKLRGIKPELTAVLITGHIDDDIYDFARLKNVGLAREGRNFREMLTDEVQRCLASKGTSESRRVELEITLDPGNGGCFYQFQCKGQPCHPARMLSVDTEKLEVLVWKSRRVHIEEPDWEMELREVGEELAEQLFLQSTPGSRQLLEEFNQWLGAVHGIDNVRIRFAVQEKLHPIALEALKRKEQDYWMLKTPIYRRLEQRNEALGLEPRGLFQDEETRTGLINFLIIQANVPTNAYAVDLDLKLDPLPNLEEEVKSLEKQLSKLKEQGSSVGVVHVIKEDTVPDSRTFTQEVEQTLRNGNWHVVHYAGHTHYDPGKDAGYVFFPGKGIKSVEPVKIDRFAWWLERTRFIFLSSCKSAERDFLFHLAKERVPAVVGFLWKVEDDKAREFAESFYRHLFSGEERSLEYACWRAKKEMHTKYADDPIWASSVLVMQIESQESRYAA